MAAAFADQLATGAELYESDPDLIEPLVKKPEQTRIRVRRATTVTGLASLGCLRIGNLALC